MAKGKKGSKKSSKDWDDSSVVNEHMQEAFRAAHISGKMGIEDSAEAATNDVGIRLPHLCLRYLFQRSAYPLERVMLIFGPPGSNKSSLMYWFYWLFYKSGGQYLHAELEDKDTPILRLSITEYDSKAGWVKPCMSLNDMQSSVATWFDWYKAVCAKGPGRRRPFVIGVDSLVAKLTEEAAEVMNEHGGVPGRRYADEARSLNDWFKLVPTYMQKWPFSLIAINHDKPKKDEKTGQPVHTSPGGSAPNFYATYKILMTKVRSMKQAASGWEGNRLKLMMDKSSMGADKQSFEVELVWRMVQGVSKSGKELSYQQTLWNWDKATVELLYDLAHKRADSKRGKLINEYLGISKCTAARWASRELGVTTTDPLPTIEFAQLLESRRDILDRLEPMLGIYDSYHYQPGVEFQEQLTEASKRVDDILPDFTRDAIVDPDKEESEQEQGEEKEAEGDEA